MAPGRHLGAVLVSQESVKLKNGTCQKCEFKRKALPEIDMDPHDLSNRLLEALKIKPNRKYISQPTGFIDKGNKLLDLSLAAYSFHD